MKKADYISNVWIKKTMKNYSGKILIFSAPSGAGKTTIVKHILLKNPNVELSVSACTRARRKDETDGKDYYFLSKEKFLIKVKNNEFLEWEEVYKDCFYGTLKPDIERIWQKGNHIIFDVDVVGGMNLKKMFKNRALAVFVKPPSVEILIKRLQSRGTESSESVEKRIQKVSGELLYEPQFDKVVINDDLQSAFTQSLNIVKDFLEQ